MSACVRAYVSEYVRAYVFVCISLFCNHFELILFLYAICSHAHALTHAPAHPHTLARSHAPRTHPPRTDSLKTQRQAHSDTPATHTAHSAVVIHSRLSSLSQQIKKKLFVQRTKMDARGERTLVQMLLA